MRYTTARPTETGWYFYRDGLPFDAPVDVVLVLRSAATGTLDKMMRSGDLIPIPDTGDWCGPIEMPED